MSQQMKSLAALLLASLAGLGAGRALPRPGGGDMLDAVAAVQRRAPHFFISERKPCARWARAGGVYLCREPRTLEEVETLLCKDRSHTGPRWAGVVCFRGTADPSFSYTPGASDGGEGCLNYGAFAVYGDPEMLREVREHLAAAGFGR